MIPKILEVVKENKFVNLSIKPYGDQIQAVLVVRTKDDEYVPPMNLIVAPDELEEALEKALDKAWSNLRRSERKAAGMNAAPPAAPADPGESEEPGEPDEPEAPSEPASSEEPVGDDEDEWEE